MRPRHACRGNHRMTCNPCTCATSFNEAAARMPRKLEIPGRTGAAGDLLQ